jgi:acyl dehydratase
VSVDPAIVGRVYPPSDPYQVGREKIREFAVATRATHPAHHDVEAAKALGYTDLVAPPTFAVVLAQRVEAQLIEDPAAGIDFSRVVHGEEKFRHHRPIVAGDSLTGILHVESVRERAGITMLTTRVELADGYGEPVSSVTSMLVIRGPEPEGDPS